MYNLQCHLLLITNLPFNPPAIPSSSATDPTNGSRIISARKTGNASSSRNPGISIDICTHDPCPDAVSCFPFPLPLPVPSPPPPSPVSAAAVCWRTSPADAVLSTSALTPTIAWVPSANPMRALPLVPGRTSVSAVSGRNWVGERPSGRMGVLGRASEV
jgi:hypothetical protein